MGIVENDCGSMSLPCYSAGYLARSLKLRHNQSPAVLGVKPAFEDVDAGSFLAFLPALVENQIKPNNGDQ